jgi:hypothetical protein
VLVNQKKKFAQAVHDRLVEIAIVNDWKQKATLAACQDDATMIDLVQASNAEREDGALYKIKADTFDCGFSDRFCAGWGYAGWKDFARINNPFYEEKTYFNKTSIDSGVLNTILSLAQGADRVAELQTIVLETFPTVKTKTAAYKLIRNVFMTAQTSSWKEFKQKSANFNHKVVKIELLEERQDTGCLTVDGNELYHDHHTVALDAGVFAGQSIQDDFFFPTTGTGRGSRVETLPGGATWDIPELDFFLNKVFRALRVPSSYMKGTQEAPGAVYNDGKVGIAYMEERIFANFIIRQQSCIEEIFDAEFKTYLQVTGINIDPDLFRLKLEEPQNFALYRQAALDAELISSFKAIEETPYLSKRFMMERFLGLTKDDMQMNEVMLKQERNIEDQLPVNSLQQMYDPNVEAPKVKVEAPESGSAEEAPPEEGGGAEEAPPEEAA